MGVMREELRHLTNIEKRHHRLLGRLALVVVATLVIDAIGTGLIWGFERNAHGSEVHNLWDAFFFTTVQLLTVSSQMKNPVTTAGRIVDIGLEVWAVVVVAGSAGAIASFFQDDRRSN